MAKKKKTGRPGSKKQHKKPQAKPQKQQPKKASAKGKPKQSKKLKPALSPRADSTLARASLVMDTDIGIVSDGESPVDPTHSP